MHEVWLRPEAAADVEAIADYTIARWGQRQARAYVDALRNDIASLSTYAKRFPLHEETRLGLRRMRSGQHLVFYLIGDHAIEVVRVLHERMHPDQASQ
ncbi:MAG: type II toxin-antitoxin system RelE/ParE family toxin [Porphyrobacter sp.]|nr:type II toxin-antitoxin system RelE/ParE family toxin [Porphyrobacter sp.]